MELIFNLGFIMKNKIIFTFIAFFTGLMLSACSNSGGSNPSTPPPANEEALGEMNEKPSHKDEHGCVFADDFEWCEPSQKCIKKGEKCELDSDAPKPARSYDLIQKAFLADHPDLIPIDFKIGIQKLTLSHLRGTIRWTDGKSETQLLASKENNDWVIVYEGEKGQYTCESVEPFSFPDEMIADCKR